MTPREALSYLDPIKAAVTDRASKRQAHKYLARYFKDLKVMYKVLRPLHENNPELIAAFERAIGEL